MADEIGIVIVSDGRKARIRLNRRSECSTCGGCFFGETAHFMIAEAEDPIGVRAGDTVRVTSRINATRAGFRLFVLPLLLLFGGFAAGSAAARALGAAATEGWGILAGVAVMTLSYVLLYRSQKRAARRGVGTMRIVRVVSGAAARREMHGGTPAPAAPGHGAGGDRGAG